MEEMLMKKIITLILSFALTFSFTDFSIFAMNNDVINTESIVAIRGKNYGEDYVVDSNKLKNTKLEDKQTVVVKADGVYIDDTRASNQVSVLLGGILVGFLVDGVLLYATGYSGAQIAAATISMMVNFIAAHPVGFIIALMITAAAAMVVQSYRTSDGNECVRVSSSQYACKFSIAE